MLSTTLLRLKRLLVQRGPVIAAVLLLLGVTALGSAVWIHQNPQTTQVTDGIHRQTVRTTLNTTATATGASGLYAPGTRLHNDPVYLQQAAPTVTLSMRTGRASDGDIRVDQRLVLEMVAVRDGTVFWRRNRTLVHTRERRKTAVSQATLNVSALREHIAQRQRQIGDAGALGLYLRVYTHYDTGRYSGTLSKRLPIDLGSNWYSIPTTSMTRTRQTEVTRTVAVPRDRMTYLAPGAFGAVSLLGGLVVAGLWRTRWQTADGELTRTLQHRAYDDWISEGSLSAVETDTPITVSSIEDLVDVAIDTDRRVVYDPARELYAVVDEAAVYYYRPPNSWDWQDAPVRREDPVEKRN